MTWVSSADHEIAAHLGRPSPILALLQVRNRRCTGLWRRSGTPLRRSPRRRDRCRLQLLKCRDSRRSLPITRQDRKDAAHRVAVYDKQVTSTSPEPNKISEHGSGTSETGEPEGPRIMAVPVSPLLP